MATQVRQNYREECEMLVNQQIHMELFASYAYLYMVRNIDSDQENIT